MKKIALIITLALVLGSCANMTDIEILDQRVREHEQEITQLNQELETVKSAQSPAATKQAEMYTNLQSIRSDLARTQDEVMRIERNLGMLEEKQGNSNMAVEQNRTDIAEVKGQLAQIASQLGMELEPGMAEKQAVAEPGMENATEPATDEAEDVAPAKTMVEPTLELYQSARQEFEQRNYEQAKDMWAEFAQKFPEHELVPNAIFWQGESYYQMREYARAVLKYQEVIDNHKNSTKYRAALLKQGISFMRLGRVKAGKLLLQDVVDKFPDSPEAKRAQIILSGN